MTVDYGLRLCSSVREGVGGASYRQRDLLKRRERITVDGGGRRRRRRIRDWASAREWWTTGVIYVSVTDQSDRHTMASGATTVSGGGGEGGCTDNVVGSTREGVGREK